MSIRLRLSFSKIMGGLIIITGLYIIYSTKVVSPDTVMLIGIGAGEIGLKQHLDSKYKRGSNYLDNNE